MSSSDSDYCLSALFVTPKKKKKKKKVPPPPTKVKSAQDPPSEPTPPPPRKVKSAKDPPAGPTPPPLNPPPSEPISPNPPPPPPPDKPVPPPPPPKPKKKKPVVVPPIIEIEMIGSLKVFDSSVDDIEMWIGAFKAFLKANKLDESTDADQCMGIFVSSLGLPTYTLLVNLLAPDDPSTKKLSDIITTLKQHFKPAPKAIAERYRFTGRRQQQGESVAVFLSELRKLALNCQFTDLETSLRDQFTFGLNSEAAQRALFKEKDNSSLKDTVAIAQAQETSEVSTAIIREQQSSQSTEQVNKTSRFRSQKKVQQQQKSRSSDQQSDDQQNKNTECPNCGSYRHLTARECPHKSVVCHNCQKRGHFARKCRSPQKNAHAVDVDDSDISDINTIMKEVTGEEKEDSITVNVKVGGVEHVMVFDTACDRSLLSLDFWKTQLNSPLLFPCKNVYRTYTGDLFRAPGQLKTTIEYNGQLVQHSIPVSPGKGSSLFGKDLLQKMKMDWSSIAQQCNEVSHVAPSLASPPIEFEDDPEAPAFDDHSEREFPLVVSSDANNGLSQKWKPETNGNEDVLSRFPSTKDLSSFTPAHTPQQAKKVTNEKLEPVPVIEEMDETTATDAVLVQVLQLNSSGWSLQRAQKAAAHGHRSVRGKIVVIPVNLRKPVLQQLLESGLETTKMKPLARAYAFCQLDPASTPMGSNMPLEAVTVKFRKVSSPLQVPANLFRGRKTRTQFVLFRPKTKSHVNNMHAKKKKQQHSKPRVRTAYPVVLVRTLPRIRSQRAKAEARRVIGPVSYLVIGKVRKRHLDHVREAMHGAIADPPPSTAAAPESPAIQQPQQAHRNPSHQHHYQK